MTETLLVQVAKGEGAVARCTIHTDLSVPCTGRSMRDSISVPVPCTGRSMRDSISVPVPCTGRSMRDSISVSVPCLELSGASAKFLSYQILLCRSIAFYVILSSVIWFHIFVVIMFVIVYLFVSTINAEII